MPFSRAKNGVRDFTWANKPTAAAFGKGAVIFISDVGVNGSLWVSDGSLWVPFGPITLLQNSLGWIVPALATADGGSYSQTGTTVTVTSTAHAIPATVHDGKSVYLNIKTGSATDGWYTDFAYVGANSFTCESSVSQSTTGDLTTNTAATTVSDLTFTLPEDIMGANGCLEIVTLSSCLTSANDKTLTAKLGSTAVVTRLITTLGGVAQEEVHRIFAQNNAAKQVALDASVVGGSGESASAIARTTVDTSADVTGTFLLTVATADEWAAIESVSVRLLPAY